MSDWNAASLAGSLDDVGNIPLGIRSLRASLAESTVIYAISIPVWWSPGCFHILRNCCCGRMRDMNRTIFVDSRPLNLMRTCNHRRSSFPYKNPILRRFTPVSNIFILSLFSTYFAENDHYIYSPLQTCISCHPLLCSQYTQRRRLTPSAPVVLQSPPFLLLMISSLVRLRN